MEPIDYRTPPTKKRPWYDRPIPWRGVFWFAICLSIASSLAGLVSASVTPFEVSIGGLDMIVAKGIVDVGSDPFAQRRATSWFEFQWRSDVHAVSMPMLMEIGPRGSHLALNLIQGGVAMLLLTLLIRFVRSDYFRTPNTPHAGAERTRAAPDSAGVENGRERDRH